MVYSTLEVQKIGGALLLRIMRPEMDNKLSIPCMSELVDAFKQAAQDKSISSIILAGGDGYFCSGGELGDFRKKSILEIKEFGNAFISLHIAMTNCPKPIIAAVEGNAFGGGFSLVEACDLAVAADTALLAVPEILDGLAPAMGFSGLFANLTKKEAMALCLLGEKLTAAQALEMGMVNRVVPKEKVMDEAVKMAAFFEGASPTAVRLFKELYADMGMRNYENRLKLGQSMMINLFKSKDGQEVLNSKEQSRAPKWCGE